MSRTQDLAPDVRVLARETNRRQAAKIRSISLPQTLHAELTDGRDLYVRGAEAGLFAVAYGRGGGLYLARVLDPTALRAQLQVAESVDVRHNRDRLPTAVRDPAEGDDA